MSFAQIAAITLSLLVVGILGSHFYLYNSRRKQCKKYVLAHARESLNSRADLFEPDLVDYCHKMLNDAEALHPFGMNHMKVENTYKSYRITMEWHWLTDELSIQLREPTFQTIINVTYPGRS